MMVKKVKSKAVVDSDNENDGLPSLRQSPSLLLPVGAPATANRRVDRELDETLPIVQRDDADTQKKGEKAQKTLTGQAGQMKKAQDPEPEPIFRHTKPEPHETSPTPQVPAPPKATEHTVSHKVVQAEPTVPRNDIDIETPPLEVGKEIEPQARDKQGAKKEGTALLDREPGKSVLPFSRVQKIIKADKDLPMVARDATFLVSLATEAFIRKLSQACQRLAERDKRATVQQKDVASVVRRVDEFLFLEEIIGSQESTGRRKPQPRSRADVGASGDQDQSQPTLHDFVQTANENEDPKGTSNFVVNEDGVMYAE